MGCIERQKGDCRGETIPRESLSGTGTPIERCDRHWDERLDWQAEHKQRYPDSPFAPAWFDPLDAGETWDEQ
jgi:hypothetical protein